MQSESTQEAVENLKNSSKEFISAVGSHLQNTVSNVLEEPIERVTQKVKEAVSGYDPRPLIRENPKTSIAAAVAVGTIVAINARHILRIASPMAGILVNAGFLLFEMQLKKNRENEVLDSAQ